MKLPKHGFKSGEEGKGSLGCIFAIVLMVLAVFLAIKLGPPYVNNYEFKNAMQQAVSRAGARSMSEEAVKKDLIELARKSGIVLDEKNIKINRTTSDVQIIVTYTVPVDFIIMKRDINFEVKESSYAM